MTAKAMERIEELADIVWDTLAEASLVDGRGGAEYERRIDGLRAWLWDEDGRLPAELERLP